MNPTPTTDTQRLRELLAAATPGPWKHVDEYADEPEHCIIKEGELFYCMVAKCVIEDENGNSPQEIADAELIAALRNETPALLEELDDLRQLKKEIDGDGLVPATRIQLLEDISEERDKLREEVERLRVLAYNDPPNEHYPGTTWKDVADWNSFACVENQNLFAKAEAERDSLRRENEELKAKLK